MLHFSYSVFSGRTVLIAKMTKYRMALRIITSKFVGRSVDSSLISGYKSNSSILK